MEVLDEISRGIDPAAEQALARFQTYLSFLSHFWRAVTQGRDASSPESLIAGILNDQRPLIAKLKAGTRLLFLSWNTETVARMASTLDLDVRFITNQWKPTQVYYALYLQLAAIHLLTAPQAKQRHEATLRFAADSIAPWFPSPWSCVYDWDNGTCRCFPWRRLPAVTSGWNLMTKHPDPFTYVGNFYRTTGTDKRDDRWRDQKRQKHNSGPRAGHRKLKRDIKVGSIAFGDVSDPKVGELPRG